MIANQHSFGFNKVILSLDLMVFALISYLISTKIYTIHIDTYLAQLPPALLVVAISLYLLSAFEITLNVSLSSLISRNLIAVVLALAILFVIIYVSGPGSGSNVYGRGVLFLTMSLFCMWLLVTRYFLFRFQRKKVPYHEWVFVGSEQHFKRLKEETRDLTRHRFTTEPMSWLEQSLERKLDAGVILDDSLYGDPLLGEKLITQKFKGATITSIDNFYQNYLQKIPLFHIKEHWFISTEGFGYINDSIRQRVKRTMDLLIVIVTLPVTLLIIAITAGLIVIMDRQNPFFSQQRIGWHGREFEIIKLRTMRTTTQENSQGSIQLANRSEVKLEEQAVDLQNRLSTCMEDDHKDQWTSKNDTRVTTVGKILRRYRLDELPQLINVLLGQMSIVGPRPEQPTYTRMLEQKIPYYDIRHSIKPGITGWAQVRFPYGASIEDSSSKLEFDLYYIKHYSIQLDLAILIKTFHTMFSGSGR